MPKLVTELPLLSCDTEGTGLDIFHGAKPFFLTTCNEQDEQQWWEWSVDPLTREPIIPPGDLEQVRELLSRHRLVFQNTKYDYQAMKALPGWDIREWWDWSKIFDTLLAAHLICSNEPHDLTTLAMMYLGVNILKYEEDLRQATLDAVKIVKAKYPTWRRARKGLSDMPSAKEKVWKLDSWIPRTVARYEGYPEDHPWWTVLRDYGNADSSVTLPLYKVQRDILKKRDLWCIYEERLKLLPITAEMEEVGITVNESKMMELKTQYKEESERTGRVLKNIAAGYEFPNEEGQLVPYDLVIPKGGKNKSLETFVFDVMKLPVVSYTDKGARALDKVAMGIYQETLDYGSRELHFVNTLRKRRQNDTHVNYIDGYERFWLDTEHEGCKLLHPSLNPTGSDTLRWTSSQPNEQNISKQEEFNLRRGFGPAPGREWWSGDAQNIELRIPAYEAGEEEMIDIFERPNDPPYYGSYHLLVFDTLHPERFAKDGKKCKELYESTWYQWTKNGNFAVGYGSVESSGTADRAYHVPGAFKRIKGRFKRIHGSGGLNAQMIAHAERHGYVETIPDKSLGCKRGYPLYCTRTERGRILPTVPLNYHVQGTAMWWMSKAMIRCKNFLDQINVASRMLSRQLLDLATQMKGRGYYLIAQVHDELMFDFPRGVGENSWETNLPVVRELKRLMEMGGDDIGLPTPVSFKYHSVCWADGMGVAL